MGSARWLRKTEIALWVVGLLLLGAALAATLQRWRYQAEQEQAFARIPSSDVSSAPALPAGPPAGTSHPGELGPHESADAGRAEAFGPPADLAKEAAAEAPAPREAAASAEPKTALDPGVIGRLEIPRLGLEAIVREGDDEETLDRAVGLVPGTARPGDGGNTALAGHRDTFFRPLRRIKVGDVIRLEVPPHTYAYRVDETRVVQPDEVSVLESRGAEELTLLTCYPFRWIGPAPERFVVKATRVP